MSNNIDLQYYKNIMVKYADIYDINNDYYILKDYDISKPNNKPPPIINEFDVSNIYFNIESTQNSGLDLNRKSIKDISSVYLPSIYLNKLKFDFKRDVTLKNFKIHDIFENELSYSIVKENNNRDLNSSHDISKSVLTNNTLIIDFSNNISVPYKITFERFYDDHIFKFNSDNIIESNILREKVNKNFNWIYSPWKQISISNETLSLTDISVNKLNDLLSNVVNQQNRPIFPSDSSAIEIINSLENGNINCVINFKYKEYDTEEDEFNNSNFSYNDSSFATILIGGISYNYYISTNLYLDSSCSLFKYLNLFQSSDPSLSDPSYVVTNNINETAIKLPLDQDISFNFTFKPYSETDTDIYYGTSLNNFKYYTSINNLIDKIPQKNHLGNHLYENDDEVTQKHASYIISPTSSTILSIGDSPIIYEENSKINMKFNKLKSNIINSTNINAKKIETNKLDVSNLVCDNITIDTILPIDNNLNYTFEPSQNIISIISNHNLVRDVNQFCCNYSTITDFCSNDLNIINSLNYDSSYTIHNNVDTSYAYILSYNSKNIISYDNCSNVLSFGISSENINTNINLDIKKNLKIKGHNFLATDDDAGFEIDSSYDLITPYTANINTVRVDDIYITSDDRLKYDEKDISNAINTIELLQPKIYVKTNNTTESGYIAQEVKNITDLSYVVDIIDDVYYLNYTAIQPYLVKSIQELYNIILTQTNTIYELKSELEMLQS